MSDQCQRARPRPTRLFEVHPSMVGRVLAKHVIEVARRIEGQSGFNVPPRRRVVERTFGWMTRWRRLVRDY